MKKSSHPKQAVWISDGRLVSHTLTDYKKSVLKKAEKQRADIDVLRSRYIKMGVLTTEGDLAKSYGG